MNISKNISNILTKIKKWKWTKHGTHPIQFEPIRYKVHPPSYFVDSFPKYFEGNWIESEQYWFSIINLDFHPLIQLRENLFIAYGSMFLNDKLFQEINYRIYYLVGFATSKMSRELDLYSDDVEYLAKKRDDIINLLNENNQRLTSYKYQYVNTLNSYSLDLFNTHFYTYSKIYKDIIQNLDIRILMYTYYYDKHTGTFPVIKIDETSQNEKSANIKVISKRLTPGKSFEDTCLFFSQISKNYKTMKKWLDLKESDLENFIHSLFDFGNNPSDIPSFDINVTGALWASLWHELKIKKYVKSTNEPLFDILTEFSQYAHKNKVSWSTYSAYISYAERRNKVVDDNKCISLTTVKSFLK